MSENNIEKIGNVTLDLRFYGGADLYCDGAVEDELLQIVKEHSAEDYPKIIAERKNWPILYHLSDLRENIVSWLRIPEGAKVLEVGSGCGAVSGVLSEKAGTLTCVELSKKRSMINAYRHRDADNMTIMVGNFEDIEPSLDTDYDYIFLIGVLEYAGSYIHADEPHRRFMEIIKKHAGKNGRIVVAIENRLGMKYFAGAREDHLGTFYSGIEDYPTGGPAQTFSRPALERIFKMAGCREMQFYYPYPDYKFMNTLYSDRRLPQVGELRNNQLHLDRDRMLLFDEQRAFDGVIREEVFPLFSNSYLVVLGGGSEVVYSKYSNDRAADKAIRTDIVDTKDGLCVEKYPCTKAAKEHISAIERAGKLLAGRYEGSELTICPVKRTKDGSGLCFPFLKGETLENLLERKGKEKDPAGIGELLQKYYALVSYNAKEKAADLDMIFSNILIHNGQWQLIDYEWTVEEARPVEEIVRRAFYVYLADHADAEMLTTDANFACLHLNKERFDPETLKKQELAFQKTVTGDRVPLGRINELLGNEVALREWMMQIWEARNVQRQQYYRAQVYFDYGKGFSEADSMYPQVEKKEDRTLEVHIPLSERMRAVRFDPAQSSCVLTILEIEGGGKIGKRIPGNGGEVRENVYSFYGDDPNLTIPLGKKGRAVELVIRYKLERLSDAWDLY
ncbi:MAG: class I SAM-dependent methyltransferase [Lachnospiraceae bacterium]|nr:class I SAM-dependent methyltransferase [Lachnospiraceae bacterium]